jgi:hypothetical protein
MAKGSTFTSDRVQRSVEAHVGLSHSPEILEPRLKQKLKSGNAIEDQPDGENLEEPVIRKVFIKKVEVVSEIQIGFTP